MTERACTLLTLYFQHFISNFVRITPVLSYLIPTSYLCPTITNARK
nr:MAG TPA: hypothetical protein [Siphoviridae sp. ctweK11]DAS95303.1 MAG TPA: hypothetical protein [Caudoviricetes sp.]